MNDIIQCASNRVRNLKNAEMHATDKYQKEVHSSCPSLAGEALRDLISSSAGGGLCCFWGEAECSRSREALRDLSREWWEPDR